jgi:hypothetical protein
MNKLRALALPAIASVSALSLAACGGGSPSTSPPVVSASTSTSSSAPAPVAAKALTAATAQTLVSHAVIGNGDLGTGWSGALIKDGGTLNDATLDYCGKTFPSDKLRLARNQTLLSSRTTTVSNEIAAYSAGGTTQAYRELEAVARSCDGSTFSHDGNTYRVSVESLPTDPSWGPTALALKSTIADLTHPSDSYADYTVYIIDGDLLAAIYTGDGPVTQDLVFQVADLSAKRLDEAIADQPRSKASLPVPAGETLTAPSKVPDSGTSSI